MGFNTTLLILNDALGHIRDDKEFGSKVANAVQQFGWRGESGKISSNFFADAARVLACHHADDTSLIAVGGGYGTVLLHVKGGQHHEREDQVRLLKALADQLGFELVEKPKKKRRPK